MTTDAGLPSDGTTGDSLPLPAIGGVGTIEAGTFGGGPASGGRRALRSALRAPGEARWVAVVFLLPAVVFLIAIVFYPLVYTLIRSLFHDGASGQATSFAGLSNYTKIFTDSSALQALKNNVIWVVIVPALVTMIGLAFAVLTERIRWAPLFKVVLFMPMAISSLACGITWSLIYVDQPSQGLGNAFVTSVHDVFSSNNSFPELHTLNATVLKGTDTSGYTSVNSYSTSSPALIPLVGLNLQKPPSSAHPAPTTTPSGPGLNGVVWNDFKLGGGGKPGQVDPGELGIPGIKVDAIQNGKTVASTTTASDGAFNFSGLTSGSYQVGLPHSDFTAPFGGFSWLGKDLITPAIIVVYLWIYAGFAMVLLAAGMAAIPRDALEAARMDGATELQVFRRVTAPLLAPVLMVVFVTMVINVLKIFDIVFILQQPAGGNAKYANVLAVQLYSDYGNQEFGAASAVGIVLVILVIPAMIFQVRRFRKENR